MHRFFGTKQKKKGGPPDPTLTDVAGNMDKRVVEIEKKIHRFDKQIMELKKKMNKSRGATKNRYKQQALKLLRQKRQYEQQRDRLMGQQMNIDSAQFATESIKDNAQMVTAMKATATQLKQTFKEVNIDEAEDLMDEMQDLMEDANEMNEIMGQAFGMDDFDEEDLLGELDDMDAELDDLDMDDEEVPSYMVSAASAANKSEVNSNSNVDEYGLPKVPAQLVQ